MGSVSVSHAKGIGNYEDFFANMAQHAGLLTTSRIGLALDFSYRGESSPDNYSTAFKARELRRLRRFSTARCPYKVMNP